MKPRPLEFKFPSLIEDHVKAPSSLITLSRAPAAGTRRHVSSGDSSYSAAFAHQSSLRRLVGVQYNGSFEGLGAKVKGLLLDDADQR